MALLVGQRVVFIAGAHKGKSPGTVHKLTPKQVYVRRDRHGAEEDPVVRVNQESVRPIESDALEPSVAPSVEPSVAPPLPPSLGIPPPPQPPVAAPAAAPSSAPPRPSLDEPPPWQLAASAAAAPSSGRRVQERVSQTVAPVSFLTEWLPEERLHVREVELRPSRAPQLPPPRLSWGDFELELLSAKLDEAAKGRHGQRTYVYRMLYVKVAGGGLPRLCLREELEKLADFRGAAQPARKLASRLELLHSPSHTHKAVRLTADDFEFIEEPSGSTGDEMSDGCGFIPDAMLLRLVGGGTGALKALRKIIDDEQLPVKKHVRGERKLHHIVEEVDAARASAGRAQGSAAASILSLVALQIRAFGPSIGVIKGVLMRKPGITKIQITPSMLKVPRSAVCNDAWASLIIANEHPFTNNRCVGRLLRGEAPPPTFKPKELSSMITRLWQGLGVPQSVIAEYMAEPPARIAHAWLVGVADPTGALPAGHLFVTGFNHSEALREVQPRSTRAPQLFITRSPCIKPADGRMLPLVVTKPAAASDEDWQWMNDLPFGAVIFSTQGDGVPLASTIADGDVDGDLYFVCWRPAILEHVKPRPPVTPAEMAGLPAAEVLLPEDTATCGGDSWLEQVQAYQTDLTALQELPLKGKLWVAMERVVDEHGIDHPDAHAFGAAFSEALERPKHGKAVHLPAHLTSVLGR